MGSGVGLEILSAAVAAAVATPKVCVLGKTVSSRLGLRTEISARYYRETTRTDALHCFGFHDKCEKSEEMPIF